MAMRCTTLTGTEPTINPTILPSSNGARTLDFIRQDTNGASPEQPLMERGSGTRVPQEWPGIGSTTPTLGRMSCTNGSNRPAMPAVNDSMGQRDNLDSVQTTARARVVARAAWTMWNVIVWCVVRGLQSIVTPAKYRAAVAVRVSSVESAGRSDVYCLTVPGLSAFCAGNGSVVHNTRYVISDNHRHARTNIDEPERTRRDKMEHRFASGSDQGWMGS
jgi:hypothetical protein